MYGFEIVPSKADYGYTRGIFGNSNGNPNDDIVFRSGTNIASDSFLEGFKWDRTKAFFFILNLYYHKLFR